MSKKLQRQLKKAFGNPDFDQELQILIKNLNNASNRSEAESRQLSHYQGMVEFLSSVRAAYDQSEKMVGIANRSLEVSSKELNFANARLSDMNRTIEAMLGNLGEGLKAAGGIQQSLLPPLTQDFDGVNIEVLYRPAEDLSGDFFDVFRDESTISFYIADVTSHGTASAQVTYLIKGLFQDIMSTTAQDLEPTHIIKEFGRRYVKYNLSYAVGLQVCRFDAAASTLMVASSNAPNPLKVRAGEGELVSVRPGPLIEPTLYDPNAAFETRSIDLAPGDQLYCFTDGVMELNENAPGSSGIRNLARLLAKAPADGWRDYLIGQLTSLNGSDRFDDDVTVLKFRLK